MKKPWSLSTTVRNPDRLRGFLKVLGQLEGETFNAANQMRYQSLLIQNRLYEPTLLTATQKQYFEDFDREMPYSVARAIFDSQNYEDPPIRGRNSAAPLNKMGLAIAKNAADHVAITPFGRYFLSENYDLGKVFFIHFLKWELPNPDSRSFSGSSGFAIKPFVGTLHLINKVNQKWRDLGNTPIGIDKEEFSLFAPTLINYNEIESQAEKLIEFRTGLRQLRTDNAKRRFKDRFKRDFTATFLETSSRDLIDQLLNNLKDYGDNTIRYFRLTRYIHIRGGGFYIDLEPRRSIETAMLLDADNASPIGFETSDEYIEFLSDIRQPVLPWQTETELRRIAANLREDVNALAADLANRSIIVPTFQFRDTTVLDIEALNHYVDKMREFRTKLQELQLHIDSQDIAKIEEFTGALRSIHSSPYKKSIELEHLATLALNALNDAIAIKPNYPVGDDNQPTFTAPANKPDIECFYTEFNTVCEVTMLSNRSQWYNEGQPVMRHVRDFENIHTGKDVYCLFIAPRLHPDTIETFWVAIKHGYRGANQKIVPLSISQFVRLLEVLLEIRRQGVTFRHEELLVLYESIVSHTENVAHSDDWVEGISNIIDSWRTSTLARS